MSIHFHSLRVAEKRQETPDAVSIQFDVPQDLKEIFRYIQGQNITLRAVLNGEEIRRSYSICASVSQDIVRIGVRKVQGGRMSGYLHDELQPGDYVDVLPPTGSFHTTLHPGHSFHYLALAAGSGITPVLSILRTTLETESGSRFTLVYGNRNRKSIMFRDELEDLKNTYPDRLQVLHILSREHTESPMNNGHIDADKCSQVLDKILAGHRPDAVFLCGPEAMIFGLRQCLIDSGIPDSSVHFELFTTSQKGPRDLTDLDRDRMPAPEKQSTIHILLDGVETVCQSSSVNQTILAAALSRGIDLPYSCRGGMCCTCRAKLEEGEVRMDVNFALVPEELAAGYILTCQSHPLTDKVVVNFDAR